jgi:putative resolvase
MRAKQVLKILNICRTTLYKYTKDGTLKSIQLDNGYFDYDEKSVYSLLKRDERYNVIYARVSTYKQKVDLQTQINKIQTYY